MSEISGECEVFGLADEVGFFLSGNPCRFTGFGGVAGGELCDVACFDECCVAFGRCRLVELV